MKPATEQKKAVKSAERAKYEAWYCEQVQEAIDQMDAGQGIPDEIFWQSVDKHMSKLHRKHGRKAA